MSVEHRLHYLWVHFLTVERSFVAGAPPPSSSMKATDGKNRYHSGSLRIKNYFSSLEREKHTEPAGSDETGKMAEMWYKNSPISLFFNWKTDGIFVICNRIRATSYIAASQHKVYPNCWCGRSNDKSANTCTRKWTTCVNSWKPCKTCAKNIQLTLIALMAKIRGRQLFLYFSEVAFFFFLRSHANAYTHLYITLTHTPTYPGKINSMRHNSGS